MHNQQLQPTLASGRFRQFMPFRDFVNSAFPWLELAGASEQEFDARATGYQFRQRLAMEIVTDHVVATGERRRAEATHEGYIKLFWQRSGLTEIEQGGRSMLLEPGSTTVWDTGREYRARFSHGSHFVVFLLPYHVCPGWERIGDSLIARRLPDQVTCSAALGATMALLRNPAVNDPDCVDEVLQSVQWMLTSALRRMAHNGRADEDHVANAVSRIQRHILEHIDEPDLGPEELAAVLCKSRRSLYLTLAKYGLTPARLISDMRLEMCKSALASPRRHRETITRIALDYGFSDAAQFSRLFKARCGMSPSEWRERALQDSSFAGEPWRVDPGSADDSNKSFQ